MAYLTQQSWSPIDLANHETKAEKNKIKTSKNVHVRIQNTAEFPVQILGNSEETERKHSVDIITIQNEHALTPVSFLPLPAQAY